MDAQAKELAAKDKEIEELKKLMKANNRQMNDKDKQIKVLH